jgi:hypothetical protein
MDKRICVLLVFFIIGSTLWGSDTSIADTVKKSLVALKYNVKSVQIVDARSKGAGRSIIVTYVHTYGDETQHLAELIVILGSGYVANSNMNAKLDDVSVIVGGTLGQAKAMVAVEVKDSERFIKDQDIVSYMKKWTVALLDRSFLPETANVMGW